MKKKFCTFFHQLLENQTVKLMQISYLALGCDVGWGLFILSMLHEAYLRERLAYFIRKMFRYDVGSHAAKDEKK